MTLKNQNNWRYLSFKESGVSLIDCDHRTPPPSDHGFPYVAIPQIKDGRIDLNDVRLISHEHFIDWTKKAKPQPHDIVLSRRCNPGETGYVRPGLDFALGQNLVLLRSNNTEIYPQFLRWLVRGPEWWDQIAKFLNVGAVFDSLKCADVPNFQFSIPPLPTQKAIAHILGTLDDKIELNRRMNETLESIARAIFKSWFIDFDPVRAKAETRQPEGMDAATAALFPSEFETADGQEIPKGWKFSTLGEHIESVKGLSYKGDGLCSNGIPLHNLNSVLEGGGYKYYGIKYYSGEYKERHILKNGDIIVANTEQGFEYLLIGYPAIIPYSYDKINLFSHHLFRVRPFVSSPCKTYFIYHLLMSPAVREQIIGCTNGTTVNMLKIDGLIIPKFVLPSTQLIDKFDDIVSLLYNKIEDNVINSRNLEALRDTLLPKLLSGELPIENPEQFTGVS